MGDFFGPMTSLETIFWVTALIGSTIFGVLFVLSFIGMDGDMEMDTDMEIEADTGAGVQFFTFKNTMAFFTIFGWTGVVCIDSGLGNLLSTFIAVVAGSAMMVLMGFIFLWISKLAESGTLRIENAIGNVGEVYLSIGAERGRTGKVTIDVQGAKRELSAMTDELQDLKQGEVIRVKNIVNGEILLVERLSKKKLETTKLIDTI